MWDRLSILPCGLAPLVLPIGLHVALPRQIQLVLELYALAHKKNFGDIKQGLICVCTKDLLYQGFLVDAELLAEYEKKWFHKVDQYHKYFKTSSPNV